MPARGPRADVARLQRYFVGFAAEPDKPVAGLRQFQTIGVLWFVCTGGNGTHAAGCQEASPQYGTA